ncbi:MAG: aminotransferase class V-fold PLP-dependent enzyme, partial [Opitutales bacterium]
ISISSLIKVLNDFRPNLVSVMAANNETGIIQPWSEVRNLCREAKVPFHCDATQWLGRLPSNELGSCDFLSGSFHKLGGPKGVGFLLAPEGETMRLMTGGEQEDGMRAGTENLPAIFSASAALDVAMSEVSDGANRDRFESRVRQLVPEAEILGPETLRLPMVSSLLLPVFENIRWVNRMDRLGFAISTGSACATGQEGPSHVLAAMRRSPEEAHRVVRVSGGWSNEPADWDALADAFGIVFEELCAEDGDSQAIAL